MEAPKRILIVDDEPSIAKSVQFILDAEGYATDVVFCGEDCFAKIEEDEFDLVLLDIMMPKMNGWQVFEEIKNRKPALNVAFLTVIKYSEAVKEKLEKEGLVDFINKPFENEDLIRRVGHIVQG
jgi:DNA-binding response OmpR family regulator